MTVRSVVAGCGGYLPERVLANEDLARMVDTSDEWIVQRTGIRERRIAAEGEFTSHLATAAGSNALDRSGMAASDLDLVVVATATPDETFPATATRVQHALGMTGGAAFDVHAVCSGFIYALNVADNFIRLGQAGSALVIGAETFSRILDWTDRGTCVLFGDGAGAVVLRAEEGGGTTADRGVLSNRIRSDGRHHDLLFVDGGPSSTRTVGHLRMSGRDVFRHAVANLATVMEETLAASGVDADEVDWVVPHQANLRIIRSTSGKLGMPEDKVIVTVDRHANTSAASIPLALAEAVGDGRIKQGDLCLLEAMGGGFAWGASLVRW